MSNYIQNLVKTRGWKEIEQIVEKEINNLKSQDVSEDLPANEYKIVSLANKKASKTILSIFHKVNMAGARAEKQNKSYK